MTAVGRSVSRVSSPAIRVNRGHQFLPRWDAALLSVVRIVVSFLFACHGAKILWGVIGGVDGQGGTAPIGSWPIWWAGVIELFGGTLVLLGLFTRPAALLCSGAMAFAYFTVHQPQAILPLQNHGELAILYCWIFLLIATLGPGRFAIDTTRWRSQSGQTLSN
ncbi:MAG TPA: DoxX family protein [Pseudonocardiaceae bacterium]|nr:DoxX family protein [Pseudonocardiaceae bacterium]